MIYSPFSFFNSLLPIACLILFGCNTVVTQEADEAKEVVLETVVEKTVTDGKKENLRDSVRNTAGEELIELTWKMLQDVTFEEKYYEEIKEYLLYPTFGTSIRELEGKSVYITGYVIPVEPERYVLSANPFASCFFCGNAGPETIVELELTSYEQMYYTDEWRTFKGSFQLNTEDIDKLNYLLVNAGPYEDE